MRVSRGVKIFFYGVTGFLLGIFLLTFMPGYLDLERGSFVEATVTGVPSGKETDLRYVTEEKVVCAITFSWGKQAHLLRTGDRVTVRHGKAEPCEHVSRPGYASGLVFPGVLVAVMAGFWVVTSFARPRDYATTPLVTGGKG